MFSRRHLFVTLAMVMLSAPNLTSATTCRKHVEAGPFSVDVNLGALLDCPSDGNSALDIFCCSSGIDIRCCSNPYEAMGMERETANIVGGVTLIILTVLILTCCCCCCCTCCRSKRRGGAILVTHQAQGGRGGYSYSNVK